MTDQTHSHRAVTQTTLAAAFLLTAIFAVPARAESPQTPPADLVRDAIRNELNDDSGLHLFAWKVRKHHGHETQVEHVVQTPSGIVSRVILINDKPLNPGQQSEEEERIHAMLDPAQMRHKQKEQQEDDARTRKMLEAIPNAFDFVLIENVPAPNGHSLDRFKFTPHAGYDPPSREVAVFTGMEGELVLDETAKRLAKVDGTLFKDVNFGWGILGRLYKGGRFLVEQSEITPTHWDTTRMFLHFNGKALIFKPIHIEDDEISSDFQPVPSMTVEQALDFLTHSDPPQSARLRR